MSAAGTLGWSAYSESCGYELVGPEGSCVLATSVGKVVVLLVLDGDDRSSAALVVGVGS
jgi:hypothetical protein